MMLDWNAYPAELNARVKEMAHLAPNAVAGFIALDKGANKSILLDAKTRELIAVTTRCDGCIGACILTAPSMPAQPAKKSPRLLVLRSMPAQPWPIRLACWMPMQQSTARQSRPPSRFRLTRVTPAYAFDVHVQSGIAGTARRSTSGRSKPKCSASSPRRAARSASSVAVDRSAPRRNVTFRFMTLTRPSGVIALRKIQFTNGDFGCVAM
jgi:hypothetical protein